MRCSFYISFKEYCITFLLLQWLVFLYWLKAFYNKIIIDDSELRAKEIFLDLIT